MAETEFTIRRKVFTIAGAKFHIFNADGNLLGFCKQKAFKLKEDIRIFTDESMQEERLLIQARKVLDFSGAYDVIDSRAQSKVGALQRQGFRSMFRDKWTVLDEADREIGAIEEDSMWMALLRRYVPMGQFVPQQFALRETGGREIARFRSHFNPFVSRLTVTVYNGCPLNPMLVLAGGLLLVAIEGRQK